MTVKERVTGGEIGKIRVDCRRRCLVSIRWQEVRRLLSLAVPSSSLRLWSWFDVEDNLLGESSFISRVIASSWMKRVYTLRRRQHDAVVPWSSETSSLHGTKEKL